jgi:malate dehydrogenase (oxaloacetate-decarboxylating)(NADP+)
MGSGRSDWPNQVNNVSCFPYMFRAALDMQATCINEAMKIAAARALADLAREEVTEEVVAANGGVALKFGRDYVIPKPFDPRMIEYLAPAIAEAAVISGVARRPMPDKEAYKAELKARVQKVHERTHALVDSYKA